MAIFVTSDTHFGHENIIKYCKRPFDNTFQMDKHLIEQWNKKISPTDTVYHLGDFGLGKSTKHFIEILDQLNGTKHLIKGNHDRRSLKDKVFHDRFASVQDYLEITVEDEEMDLDQKIILCHYPFETWNQSHHGSWHLHGHCHGNLPSRDEIARLDVGVDSHNYMPLSYEEVKELMTRKVIKPVSKFDGGYV
jgi:calcineurin-like phosphoesterase family protein